jgi:hypothetical protein
MPSAPPACACFGPTAGRRPAGGLQGLHQGFPRPPRHPHRRTTATSPRSTGARLHPRAGRAHRGQGRRPGRRQGRDRGHDPRRGRGRGARHARRQRLRRRRRAGGDRGVPRGRGGQLHRHGRRRATCCRWPPARTTSASATGDTGPNTGGMGAYSPAPVVTDEVHDRIMERGHPAHRARHGRRGQPLHRLPLRRPDDRRRRRAQGDRVQLCASATPRPSRS